MKERLQKILARAGLGSRRHIEEWIRLGRVAVNGRVASLGDSATPRDTITLDGKAVEVEFNEPTRVLIYHKMVGEVCSRQDTEGRPTVFENLPKLRMGKWINIGRLDFNTTGLLLFTNDGELAHRLMHPSSNIEREYAVRVYGEVNEPVMNRLTTGVMLEDGMAKFDHIMEKEAEGANRWFHVVVKEGRNRLVRRLWESQGLVVSRLIRVRFGCVTLDRDYRPGRSYELKGNRLEKLMALVGYTPLKKITESKPIKPESRRMDAKKYLERHGGGYKSRRGTKR